MDQSDYEDTVTKFNGSAGQSFGAFIPKGMTLSRKVMRMIIL